MNTRRLLPPVPTFVIVDIEAGRRRRMESLFPPESLPVRFDYSFTWAAWTAWCSFLQPFPPHQSGPALLPRAWQRGRAHRQMLFWIDDYVLEEARRNLTAKEPAALAALHVLLPQLHIGALRVAHPTVLANLPLPEKDKPVLAAAIHHRCAVMITGDHTHFGRLYGRTISGVTVHSPGSAAVRLLTAARKP